MQQGIEVVNSEKNLNICNLRDAVDLALLIPRDRVIAASKKWTWEECWLIFKENLVSLTGQIKY